MYSKCCDIGGFYKVAEFPEGWWLYDTFTHEKLAKVSFCPWCGHDLSLPFMSLKEWLDTLENLPNPKRMPICFDVDGLLCNNVDESVPYADRQPYPWAGEVLHRLKAMGYRIVLQTARYMRKFAGHELAAANYGRKELEAWAAAHAIPCDEVRFGKASSEIYADDKGCHVDSNAGTIHWTTRLLPRIYQLSAGEEPKCQPTNTNVTTATTTTKSHAQS
jgi:hypothetical protein